jgi:hypothetical protein
MAANWLQVAGLRPEGFFQQVADLTSRVITPFSAQSLPLNLSTLKQVPGEKGLL